MRQVLEARGAGRAEEQVFSPHLPHPPCLLQLEILYCTLLQMFIQRKLCGVSAEINQVITALFKKLLTDAGVKAFVGYFSRYVLQHFIPYYLTNILVLFTLR